VARNAEAGSDVLGLDPTARIEVGLEGYGDRWLRLRRPEDEADHLNSGRPPERPSDLQKRHTSRAHVSSRHVQDV
jgi:hypothetical protein